MSRGHLSLIVALATTALSRPVTAAAPVTVVAPPVFVAVDADSQRLLQSEWNTGRSSLAQDFLTNPVPMPSKNPAATFNASHAANAYQAGSPRDPSLDDVMLQPTFCAMGDRLVTALEAVRLTDGRLLAGVHTTQANPFPEAQRHQAAGPFLTADTWTYLATALRTRLGSSPARGPRADALNIGTQVARETNSPRRGALSCLSLLLSHEWATTQAILSTTAAFNWGFTTRFLGLATTPQRATRQLTLEWRFASLAPLPSTGSLQARLSEGTMAQGILPGLAEDKVILQANGRQLTLSPLPKIQAFLAGEAASLRLADGPRILKKDRAWVYVDRGRAWGLKMDDRLITEDQGVVIKGHVVGYFGPSLGLQNAEGRPVREGAIIFIRKGQKEARAGLTFRFDPTTYPTDWPPRPTP